VTDCFISDNLCPGTHTCNNQMNRLQKVILLGLLTALALPFVSGCASTRSENGVTFQKNRSYNLLDYLPL